MNGLIYLFVYLNLYFLYKPLNNENYLYTMNIFLIISLFCRHIIIILHTIWYCGFLATLYYWIILWSIWYITWELKNVYRPSDVLHFTHISALSFYNQVELILCYMLYKCTDTLLISLGGFALLDALLLVGVSLLGCCSLLLRMAPHGQPIDTWDYCG